jgi:hypothetical protein
VVGEFWSIENVRKFNPATCFVETSLQYLSRINGEIAMRLPSANDIRPPEEIRSDQIRELANARSKLFRFATKRKLEFIESDFIEGKFGGMHKKDLEERFLELKNAWSELTEVKFSRGGWSEGFFQFYLDGELEHYKAAKLNTTKSTLGEPLLEKLFDEAEPIATA